MRKIFALLSVLTLSVGSALAQDTRIVVNSCSFTGFAGTFASGVEWQRNIVSFTAPDGAVYYMERNMSALSKWNTSTSEWEDVTLGVIFNEGTYRYRVQLRIDGSNGTTHVLPASESDLTVTVDGEEWTVFGVGIYPDYSFAWVRSPEFMLTHVDLPLVLSDVPALDYNVNYLNTAVTEKDLKTYTSGGTGSYTYSKTTNNAAWLTVSAEGIISGTPTALDPNSTFDSIRVTDGVQADTIRITVGPVYPQPANREIVSATSFTGWTQPAKGDLVAKLSLTPAAGAKYYTVNSNSIISKQNGENWDVVAVGTPYEVGTYRARVQLRIDDENGRYYRLANDGTLTATVDGEAWVVSDGVNVFDDNSYAYLYHTFTLYKDPEVGDTIINQVDGKDVYFKITSLDPREAKLIKHNDWPAAFTGALNIPDEAVNELGEKYAVVEIAEDAVRSQYQITSVKLPKGLRRINAYAFQSCGISSVTFPASIEYIATFSFGSTALEELHFEGTDHLQQIIANAFGYTPLLENASDGWIIADSVVIDYRGISPELLAVPDSVTFISMLHSRASGYSHNWEATTGVRLGHKVKAISMGAFSDCENATYLSICAPIPPKVSYSATKPFQGRENTMRLKLSCELTDAELTAYNEADYWGNHFEGIDTTLIWNVTLNQTTGGTIAKEETADCGKIKLTATPASGYKFVKWSDDSDENPHTIDVTSDVSVSAVFAVATGIDQTSNVKSQMSNKIIKDNQLFILRGDKTYTVTGQEVK